MISELHFEPLFSKFGQETEKLQQKMCWLLILNQTPVYLLTTSVSLIFQDFCRKILKDLYIFENDFINMFGLIHTSHLHRNVNILGQSTGIVLVPILTRTRNDAPRCIQVLFMNRKTYDIKRFEVSSR